MNRNPFEVLGLPNGADDNAVKEAYRSLARRYSINGEAPDGAKMREIDEAYDAIILSRTGGGSQQSYGNASYSYSTASSGLSDVRAKINAGRIDEAEALLNSVYVGQRTAEWYYLMGTVQHRKGWLEDAANNFERAAQMEPDNAEYRRAASNINSDRAGGYRTERKTEKKSSGCSACDICSGLLCADCCCECFGGDLIPCC